MPSVLHLIIFSTLVTTAAHAGGWTSVTSKKHPDCTAETPCRIIESTAVFEVTLEPTIREGMKSMHEVVIKELKSGTSEKFKVSEMNDIKIDEHFDLRKIQLGQYSGLALHAYNSAREGESYYYFLYDKAKRKYILSDSTVPRLTWNAKAKAFVTPVEETKYVIDKNLKIIDK